MEIILTIISWLFGALGVILCWVFIGYLISLCIHIIQEKEFLVGHLTCNSVIDEHCFAGPLLLLGLVAITLQEYTENNKDKVIWRSKTKCAEKALFGDKDGE